ncbi:MAG: FHA domain-containing protein [Lachnospiraceae bacterium]|nr:FHA domain-containing protein [Lachnospiraceae bacterium]
MNRKSALDIAILISCTTGIILSYVYLDNPMEKQVSLTILIVVGILFLILAIADAQRKERTGKYEIRRRGISEILLLGEENNVTAVWDIYGKTSVVFGKDVRENQVDVNFKNTDYAGTVDVEHAVMNYSNGSWYIEDLDSENGTRLQRGGEGKKYRVSSREPCKVEKNDIIYLGLAPIKIR